jgi:carbonic anhydrase
MANSEESEIHATIKEQYDIDTRALEFRTVSDQQRALAIDVQRIRSYPLIRKGVSVAGAIYDVSNGSIKPIDC